MDVVALEAQGITGAVQAFMMLPDHDQNLFREIRGLQEFSPPMGMRLDLFPLRIT